MEIEDVNNDNIRIKSTPVVLENELSPEQEKLLNCIAKAEGFTDYEIRTTLISSNFGNYLGLLYDVLIRGKKQTNRNILHLFMKTAASDENIKEVISLHDVYCSEIFVYKVLSKAYTDLQTDKAIPENKMFKFPQFYGCIENNQETIVLENLTYKSYVVQDRLKCVNLDYAMLALDNLARFHAISYTLEKHNPDLFKVMKEMKGNIFLDKSKPNEDLVFKSIENIRKYLKNRAYEEKLVDVNRKMHKDFSPYVKTNRYPTVCHGDYRVNNLLVRYKNEKLESIVTVDYQFVHFGSPLNDVIYFIFGATDRTFRQLHLSFLIEHYYECLRKALQVFSIDVADVYPKAAFDEDVKSHMMIGLVTCFTVLSYILHPEDSEKLDDKSEQSVNDVYSERFNGVIDDFIQWGYI